MTSATDLAPPRRAARRSWNVPPWRWAVRALVALALAGGLAELPYWLFRTSGLDRYLELRERLAVVSSRNRQRSRANALLRAEAIALENDYAVIERVARDQLGLVRPGEVIFQIETPRGAEPAPEAQPERKPAERKPARRSNR
jgi:cell division protein FtsB